ncbi:MAG: NAD(P)-dependent oxidoreductase [Candidatus Binatia bacterium]|nr:NAD(P)-dependent oxidoreductase [Candidatus Binatia bacterium]
MRVLIVGASGFVGSALMDAFAGQAIGTYFQHPKPGLLPLDIRDGQEVAKMVAEVRPAWIFVPAAQPHVDWCEDHPEESRDVNVQGPATVARVAHAHGARVLFFSTDYVFDGAAGPYSERAEPSPINVYGEQKLAAEGLVLAANPENLIVRVCGVYGCEWPPKNFVMTLLKRLRSGEEIRVPSDQWGTPTYVRDIARAVRCLVDAAQAGVWHVAAPDFLPRHEFARRVCAVFGLDPTRIQPTPTAALGQRARRPLRGGLQARRLEEFGFSCRDVDAGLQALAVEVQRQGLQ